MKITFHHPPVPIGNPFTNFNPNNPWHYPKCGGVYIFGMNLNIEGQGQKFVPMYVGDSINLQNRLLTEHYKGFKKGGDSVKELFDFSLNSFTAAQLGNRYRDMRIYDSYCGQQNKLKKILLHHPSLQHLIYFQDMAFYDAKVHGNNYSAQAQKMIMNNLKGNLSQDQINYLNHPPLSYVNLVNATKQNFTSNFYYLYACYDKHVGNTEALSKKDKENLEYATKEALNQVGIHTTAKANENTNGQITVDFTNVQNELVNLGFDSKKPLIIAVP